MRFDGSLRNSPEILGIWRNDDVYVFRASHDSPSIDCEATNQNELDTRLGEPAEKLIESRLGQLRRAAPVNRISW